MRVLLQRVLSAAVSVRGEEVARIGPGLLLLVGSGREDGDGEPVRLAAKISGIRVFEDANGKMNLGLRETGGEVLVVPQFTLFGDVTKGRRPSWDAAAPPDEAAARIKQFASELERLGVRVSHGAFRERMQIELVNDGPVSLLIDGAGL